MDFVCYTSLAELPKYAEKRFAQAEEQSVFSSYPWLDNLANSAPVEGQNILLACVLEGKEIWAILPLMNRGGDTWHSLKHRYGSLYSLLIAQHKQDEILTCLAKGLSRLPIAGLLLEPIDQDDSHINRLQTHLEKAGFSCNRSFRFYNWVLKLEGQTYDDYLRDRPARLRNTLARKQRKLGREHGFEIRLFCGEEVPQNMLHYYAAYSASWKANEQYRPFVDGMVNQFSTRGWTRLAVLYINQQPAAAQLWFVAHRKASIFRLAYDETWKSYSPGSILTAFLMRYVIDTDQVEEVDFLTGNEPYKQDWMSERRERWALSCVKNTEPETRLKKLVKSAKRFIKPS